MYRNRPGAPANLTIFPFELLERDWHGRRLMPAAAPFGDHQQFGRHDGQVMIGLVTVGAGAEVDLGYGI